MQNAEVRTEYLERIGNTVCVTDASSYVGSRIVRRLLEGGYIVHAFLRYDNTGEAEDLIVLREERLRIFRNPNRIMDALRGCFGLFYNFQRPPFESHYNEEMIPSEEEAARDAMEACTQVLSVRKFVLTSSLATAIWRPWIPDAPPIDHTTLSDEDYCRGMQNWYALAKRAVERVVEREVANLRENSPTRRFKEMTINSALVVDSNMDFRNVEAIVPYFHSFETFLRMVDTLATVSINFLVDAHICVYEASSARGRYLCFNTVVRNGAEATRLAQRVERRLAVVIPWIGNLYLRGQIQSRLDESKLLMIMRPFIERRIREARNVIYNVD